MEITQIIGIILFLGGISFLTAFIYKRVEKKEKKQEEELFSEVEAVNKLIKHVRDHPKLWEHNLGDGGHGFIFLQQNGKTLAMLKDNGDVVYPRGLEANTQQQREIYDLVHLIEERDKIEKIKQAFKQIGI